MTPASRPLCAILASRFPYDWPKVPRLGLRAGFGALGQNGRDDCRGSQDAARRHSKGGGRVQVLKGGGIPTAADRTPGLRWGQGERDPGGMADDGGLRPPPWGRHSVRGF